MSMNSHHYDVIIYTKEADKGVKKIEKLMKENNENIFKIYHNEKYIYVDTNIPEPDVIENIYPYCLPHTEDWKKRIHKF